MHVLAFMQGPYGERIIGNIRQRCPADWMVESFVLPRFLPAIIDEPDEYISGDLPKTNLIVFLSESTQAPQLIPDLAAMTGAKAVIAPIDSASWLPSGLKNQLKKELADLGIAAAFPKTFCTLTESSVGYRHSAEAYDDETIAAFGRHFGRPKLKITVNPDTKIIEAVHVERGAPCGSTHHMAKALVGLSADEAVPKAGLISHHYPCQASMQAEQLDKALFDTLMHLSGYVVNEEVEEQIRPFLTPPLRVVPPAI